MVAARIAAGGWSRSRGIVRQLAHACLQARQRLLDVLDFTRSGTQRRPLLAGDRVGAHLGARLRLGIGRFAAD